MAEFALPPSARRVLADRGRLYWVVGGAGAGKSTVCRILAQRHHFTLYDMDGQIYGAYHGRFDPVRHPVNDAWSKADNGLAWLLSKSWDEFLRFQQEALPEYLDLLAEDLAAMPPDVAILVDGGICNPALAAQVVSPRRMLCVAAPETDGRSVWQTDEERQAMRAMVEQLAEPPDAWARFLEYDRRITATILQECRESGIVICTRGGDETVEPFAAQVARHLGLESAAAR